MWGILEGQREVRSASCPETLPPHQPSVVSRELCLLNRKVSKGAPPPPTFGAIKARPAASRPLGSPHPQRAVQAASCFGGWSFVPWRRPPGGPGPGWGRCARGQAHNEARSLVVPCQGSGNKSLAGLHNEERGGRVGGR